MYDHLRVELAATLLYDSPSDDYPSGALLERVEALRQSWRASESEDVRKARFRRWRGSR